MVDMNDPWLPEEYPRVWERSLRADFNERSGRKVDQFDAECAAVLHELWLARQKVVQGFMFNTAPKHDRNFTVCKIIERADVSDAVLRDQGPAFLVEFGDGERMVAHSSELHPWYPTE